MPLIPTPMWASIIIGTSFAPSPIETVTHGPLDFARATMSAFYFGDTRQHTTELASNAILKNSAAVSGSESAKVKVGPSITIDNLSFLLFSFLSQLS